MQVADPPLWGSLAVLIPVALAWVAGLASTAHYYLLRWKDGKRAGVARLPFFHSLAHHIVPWPARPHGVAL